jgi:hypothetical protein
MQKQGRYSPVTSLMPVKATSTLDQEIDGAQIRHHKVEIQIKRLFDDLGSNKNFPSPQLVCRFLPECFDDVILDLESVPHGEPRMEQSDVDTGRHENIVGFDGFPNSIANPGDTLTGLRFIHDPGDNTVNRGSSFNADRSAIATIILIPRSKFIPLDHMPA